MICLTSTGKLASWIVIIIIGREFIISGFRLVASDNGIVIAASKWGKFKTASQMLMIILLILDFGGAFTIINTAVVYLALVLTVLSLVDYIAKNKEILTKGGMSRSRQQKVRSASQRKQTRSVRNRFGSS